MQKATPSRRRETARARGESARRKKIEWLIGLIEQYGGDLDREALVELRGLCDRLIDQIDEKRAADAADDEIIWLRRAISR